MKMDRDSYELSWAHGYEPECERCSVVLLQKNLPDVAYHPSNQKPSEPHIRFVIHLLCAGLRMIPVLAEKHRPPPPTMILSTLYTFQTQT